jgi:hypothetical protein
MNEIVVNDMRVWVREVHTVDGLRYEVVEDAEDFEPLVSESDRVNAFDAAFWMLST